MLPKTHSAQSSEQQQKQYFIILQIQIIIEKKSNKEESQRNGLQIDSFKSNKFKRKHTNPVNKDTTAVAI
ncbi:hypothetical protein TTHERM_000522939 (macronuclear) [Tetrahymena thermophila SB210]|uniref:Uncharacterized protein n=1 Tax=Tetrahymena thermophila (strain SB210) TaxID=312017 RepID=W7XK82_TETTS|nr:hypothetical protein TTHERM_000522939 [Tetrahymena thermophila SB210]EWS74694.1 hypothetical protein TTHERM_000522939 [Tetrahymena thermophila SB210]|eukprot:XP_012652784.1 hypothetical protein TTHERM_000522939 [Tetrahymena thermophila SB210]